MTCQACEIARRNPETGRLTDGCRGCNVRMVSNQPRHVREAYIAGLRVTEGDAAAEQFLRDVVDEFNRRQAWKRSGRQA